jgi:hypothetical protein
MLGNLIANTIGNALVPGTTGAGGGGSSSVTFYYFPILGQSQAGAYNSTPSLTVTPNSNIKTLTNGPIDVDTAGNLIDCIEGDTFSDTGGPAATPDVESIATSFAQQLRIWAGSNSLHRFGVTIHATGGTTLQQLSKGTTRYNELIAAVTRIKTICNTNGWILRVHPILFHGGTGDNTTTTYKAKVLQLYTDLNTDINAIVNHTRYIFTHQQRFIAAASRVPASSVDYGQQQYEAMLDNPNIVVVSPEYKTIYQGDGVHFTNHGERYIAMIWARAVYRKLFSTGFRPLELDVANFTFTSGKIIIPVLNASGSLVKTIDAGIEVFSTTTSATIAGTVAINGSNLEFTPTVVPVGSHDLEIRTNVTANGELRDSAGVSDGLTTTFVDGSAVPYDLNKYLVRAIYTKTLLFPINATVRFGGSGADPGVANTFVVWDNTKSTSDEVYVLQGNFQVTAVNTPTNFWGFQSATDSKAGNQAITGTNIYDNNILANYNFCETVPVGLKLKLNPNKFYNFNFVSCRVAATDRKTNFTINGVTVTTVSNKAASGDIYISTAEDAKFTNIQADSNGEILITVQYAGTDGNNFGYLNAIIIAEL